VTKEGRKMNSNTLEETMINRYIDIYSKNDKPTGMINLPPAIPFIGRKYQNMSPKIISYASAENLSDYYDSELKPNDSKLHQLETREKFNRSRYFYSNHSSEFPHIHIEPFNNGTQLLITRHILSKLGYNQSFGMKPYDFIEQISVANPGKFSVISKSNQDYASDKIKLSYSIEYIREDLKFLKPNIIILPRTVFNTVNKISNWKCLLREAKMSTAIFVKIYQVSFYNNFRIRKAVQDLLPSTLNEYEYGEWLDLLDCSQIDIDSYLSWIEHELYEKETVTMK